MEEEKRQIGRWELDQTARPQKVEKKMERTDVLY